ncbi:MAG TPA: hypothetical protein VKB93_25705 [Thermoanaerobaculia bacterium]|nr:hypothetical protein [Thermoanaerobaculia bacterium]
MTTIDPAISLPVPATPATPAVPVPAAGGETKQESARLWFKEIITALLALIILGALLAAYWRLGELPNTAIADQAVRAANAANVDKIATALFGILAAFVGYYAGRVPAEKAAADSRAAADQAQQVAVQSQTQAVTATQKLEQEQAWSERSTEMLAQAVPLLDSQQPNNVVAGAEVSASALAARIKRHLGNRRIG